MSERFDAILGDVCRRIVEAAPDDVRNAVIVANPADGEVIAHGLAARGYDPSLMYLRAVPVAVTMWRETITVLILGDRRIAL